LTLQPKVAVRNRLAAGARGLGGGVEMANGPAMGDSFCLREINIPMNTLISPGKIGASGDFCKLTLSPDHTLDDSINSPACFTVF
jgi:hypothetical protein